MDNLVSTVLPAKHAMDDWVFKQEGSREVFEGIDHWKLEILFYDVFHNYCKGIRKFFSENEIWLLNELFSLLYVTINPLFQDTFIYLAKRLHKLLYLWRKAQISYLCLQYFRIHLSQIPLEAKLRLKIPFDLTSLYLVQKSFLP